MNTKIYLAPMSGITDLAFRLLCRKFGARHCFFEMLDANAVIYNHRATLSMLKTLKSDLPISAQLLGGDPGVMLDAAELIMPLAKLSSLDINSACPAKKVLKKRAGAALLNDTPRLGRIIKRLSSRLRKPVTVKLRTGFLKRDVKGCVKTAKICEASGASTIYIHGRTMAQGYSGDCDYEAIRAVKEAVGIPVFGSGNILSPQLARRMYDETGCDGILVARGAFGNPWIFKDIEDHFKRGRMPRERSLSGKKAVLKSHLSYIDRYSAMSEGSKEGFKRKVAMWYIKGVPNASRIRDSITRSRDIGDCPIASIPR